MGPGGMKGELEALLSKDQDFHKDQGRFPFPPQNNKQNKQKTESSWGLT